MADPLKNLLFRNLGLKASALALALLVWAVISGGERAYSEKTLKLPVEVVHVSENLEVSGLRPEEVTVSLKGASKFVAAVGAEANAIRIDLANVKETGKLNYFAEDYLDLPEGVQVVSIHPKMIEVFVEEFVTREVPVRLQLRGRLPASLRLLSARVLPDRIAVMGYKSRIERIDAVLTEEFDLGTATGSLTRRLALRQTPDILKFRDRRDVDLQLEIEERGPRK